MAKKPDDRHNSYVSGWLRVTVAIAILIIGLIVALSPTVVYAPAPKIVLYCLISFLPAILLSAEAAARFSFRMLGFFFTTGGAAAVSLGTLLLLSHLSKPEQQIAVFHILDDHRQPLPNLNRPGAVEVPITRQGLTVTRLVDGNALVLIFPEQVGECVVRVRPLSVGRSYSGTVRYSGNREDELILGEHLKSE